MARGGFGKRGVKTRKASVSLSGDNTGSLGQRKPIGVMMEGGQDAEAHDYPAGRTTKGVGKKNKPSPGIVTRGKGNG